MLLVTVMMFLFAGIDLVGSDYKMLNQVVSTPTDEMLFSASDINALEGLEENFVQFVCDGQYTKPNIRTPFHRTILSPTKLILSPIH